MIEGTRKEVIMTPYERFKKWREKHPARRNEERMKYFVRGRRWAKRNRNEWQSWELNLLTSNPRQSDRMLAKRLGRTIQAIQAKRYRVRDEPANHIPISNIPPSNTNEFPAQPVTEEIATGVE